MLFDLGWSEILLIGTVALVFIGPKDLPKALRVAGYWVRKARTLSREFQSSIDQMIREAELDEIRQDLKKATEFDLDKEFRNTIDPTGSLEESLKPPELPSFALAEPSPALTAGGSVATAEAAPGLPESAPAAPASVEPASVEPASVEPASVEPVSVEPVSAEPVSAEISGVALTPPEATAPAAAGSPARPDDLAGSEPAPPAGAPRDAGTYDIVPPKP